MNVALGVPDGDIVESPVVDGDTVHDLVFVPVIVALRVPVDVAVCVKDGETVCVVEGVIVSL